jgi:hypothetical protein
MGCHHIELSDASKELCTIARQGGKIRTPTALNGTMQQSQHFPRRNERSAQWARHRCVCINDVLYVTKGSWEDHLEGLEEVFRRLQQAGLKVNAKKSNFGAHKMEHLGYNITHTGIQPVTKKGQAIQAIKVPKTHEQLRGFIGMINFHRDMWKN